MRASSRVFGRARRPALAGVMTIALTACASDAGPRRDAPAVVLDGSIVAYQFESVYLVRALAGGRDVEVSVPVGTETGSFPIAAFPEQDGGSVVMVVTTGLFGPGRGIVMRAPMGGDGETEVFRPRIPAIASASRSGDRLLVGSCTATPRLLLMDLSRPNADPREVAPACVGALTPNGRDVLYSLADGGVWSVPVDGGSEPVRLFSVHDAPGIADQLPPRRRAVQRVVPGPDGTLAVTAGGDESFGEIVIIRTADGELRIVPRVGASSVSALAWQPGGRLLAIALGFTGGEGVVRVIDPRDGSLTAVAVDGDGFGSALWSPDGELLMVAGLRGGFVGGIDSWAAVDLTGKRVATLRSRAEILLAWIP